VFKATWEKKAIGEEYCKSWMRGRCKQRMMVIKDWKGKT
jgi:hypothetical protein